ncbi:MAG: response regulator transcription factor [Deltaproteobacteria bacterium]|nr:response regulator transcription factor [Deltaproteobacteria bacterium]
MLRVLIAEDEEIIRKALALLAGSFAGITVVGEAKNGREAITLAGELTPDVILMDLLMPVLDGVAATREIKKANSSIKVIALTALGGGREISDGLAAGLDGYVLKKAPPEELRIAIETTAAGGRHIGGEVAEAIARAFRDLSSGVPPGGKAVSPREAEVLELLSQGCRAKEIATRLGISVRTVEKHRDSLRRKYGAETIAELVAAYVKEQLGGGETPPR